MTGQEARLILDVRISRLDHANDVNEALEVAKAALEEIQLYRSIGTVEECQEAMERQRTKKPNLFMNEESRMFVDYAKGHGKHKVQMNNWWRCPCCNEVVGQRVIAHKHIHDQRKKKYCENCGQAIDWNEQTRKEVLEVAACGNSRSKRSEANLYGVRVEERSKA